MNAASLLHARRFHIAAALLVNLAFGRVVFGAAQEEYTIHPPRDEIVFHVALAPDGQLFAVTQPDRVLLYDTATAKLVRTIVSKSTKMTPYGPGGTVNGLDFSPDGKLLAGGRADGAICLWKTASPEEQPLTLDGHKYWVDCVRFSPDGNVLASGGRDHKTILWDVRRQQISVSLSGHDDYVKCVAFAPSGKLLASGGEDDKVKLWDVATRRETATLSGGRGAVSAVVFSPDGKTVLCGDEQGEIRIWDVNTGQQKAVLTGHGSGVRGLRVFRDNRTAISGARDGTLRAWDLQRQKQIGCVTTRDRQSVESVAVSEDEKYVLCAGFRMILKSDRGTEMWDRDSIIQLIKVDRILNSGRLSGKK